MDIADTNGQRRTERDNIFVRRWHIGWHIDERRYTLSSLRAAVRSLADRTFLS